MLHGRRRTRGVIVAAAVLAAAAGPARAGGPSEVKVSGTGPMIPVPAVVSAPAYPQVVVQGGEIPKGWTPQPVPYSGIGPDGRPVTLYFAPTYTFTYAIGPPVAVAAPVARSASKPPPAAARPQAIVAARPSVPYGTPWVFQTQGLQPVDPGVVVARPYELPTPPSQWVAAPFPAPAPVSLPATPPPSFAPPTSFAPLQPPPSQWIPASEALAAAAPSAMAAGAAAIAPQPIPTSASAATPGITASLSPAVGTPSAPPLDPIQDPSRAAPAPQFWRVVGVVDGDTVTCIDDTNTKYKVRLAEIDAPEIGQDYGKSARDALAELVFGKTVEVRDDGTDSLGRKICRMYVDGTDVNRQMVATGNAWQYAPSSSDEMLASLQQQAQASRVGLWAQPNPTPPWEFRRNGGKPAATT